MMTCQLLVAIDFDHTIIEENSDVTVRKLVPSHTLPKELHYLISEHKYTEYMSEIFKLLHQHNVSKSTIIEAIQKLTPTQKMTEFILWLKDEGHETIIITDSNSVFITEWLKHQNLLECITRVFANPARFEENDLLTIAPYHEQDWCNISTKSLCKGYVLEEYLRERQEQGDRFDAIVYVGDGQNDFCPTLKLKENDFVFPRAGFPLEKLIKNPPKNFPFEGKEVIARVHPWVSARDIIHYLRE